MRSATPKPAAPKPPPHPLRFVVLAQDLLAAGRPIPIPLERAINGDPVPLALTTRQDLPAWCELRGYSAEQAALLSNAIGELVYSPRYLEAVARELAERVDVDGQAIEPVSREHALAAALTLHTREMRKGARRLEVAS